MKNLLELFAVFFKVAISTFGGGYAMLPILQEEVVRKRKWATEEDLVDYYAISQCTPGIIGVNVATFIGRRQGGIIGGIIATLGVIMPSILLISLCALVLGEYIHNPYVEHALRGVRVFMIALIFHTTFVLLKKSVTDISTAIIFAVCLVLTYFNLNIILIILLSVALGHIFAALPKGEKK